MQKLREEKGKSNLTNIQSWEKRGEHFSGKEGKKIGARPGNGSRTERKGQNNLDGAEDLGTKTLRGEGFTNYP